MAGGAPPYNGRIQQDRSFIRKMLSCLFDVGRSELGVRRSSQKKPTFLHNLAPGLGQYPSERAQPGTTTINKRTDMKKSEKEIKKTLKLRDIKIKKDVKGGWGVIGAALGSSTPSTSTKTDGGKVKVYDFSG